MFDSYVNHQNCVFENEFVAVGMIQNSKYRRMEIADSSRKSKEFFIGMNIAEFVILCGNDPLCSGNKIVWSVFSDPILAELKCSAQPQITCNAYETTE